MNKKNTRLVSALNHAAALVGERQSLNGMETGFGLTLQRDRCLEEVRTITDGLFRWSSWVHSLRARVPS